MTGHTNKADSYRALSTGCVVLLTAILVFAMATCMMSDRGSNYVRLGTELKGNLHRIQLAVDKYAVDHEGEYPQYLIGGEAKCSEFRKTVDGPGEFVNVVEVPAAQASDPLLREGYIDYYLRNPFVRTGEYKHLIQSNEYSDYSSSDPLRNDSEMGFLSGTRFGPYCSTMGNVLPDPRFTQRRVTAADDPKGINFPTYADFEFRAWDTWIDDHPSMSYAGDFFYKSHADTLRMNLVDQAVDSPLVINETEPHQPERISGYVLGVYGDIRTKGLDVIGEEQSVNCRLADPQSPKEQITCQLWLWTRSEISDDQVVFGGSPYTAWDMQGNNPGYGNSNGIPDAVILLLGSSHMKSEYEPGE